MAGGKRAVGAGLQPSRPLQGGAHCFWCCVKEALHERAHWRVPRALREWNQRVERVELEVFENGGNEGSQDPRPRQEHKHTVQTGRTNPTRLGSSPRL
jgi:hypothetical protein